MILQGSYDLYINNACNLHCQKCSVLDWNGKATIHHMDMWEINRIFDKIKKLCLTFEEIKIVGGEPTLHKQFSEIIDYIRNEHTTHQKLTVITNGLNLTDEVVNSLLKVDRVVFSVYPGMPIENDIIESGLHKKLQSVEYWHQDYFLHLKEPSKMVEVMGTTPEKNWNICYVKDNCLTITEEGLYRCVVAMNDRSDLCEWNDADEVKTYVERDAPLAACTDCCWPPKKNPWKSLNAKADNKNYNKGLELIRSVNV